VTKNIEFIGIGAPRCGTSWIANVLRAHADICISEPKEVRYFNRNEMQVGKLKGNVNANFDQDISWYLKRFSHAKEGQLCGEISPVYLSDHDAPAAIKAQYPDVKLIVCLRNPVDRAFSFYKLHRGNSIIEPMTFEQALEKESVYIETGLYGQHMARYLEHFDSEKILFLIFEELIAEPERELIRIFEFLGVEPPANLDPSKYHTNESAKRRSNKLHKFAFKFSQWLIGHGFSKVLEWLRAAGAHKLLNKVNAAPVQRETMQDATRKKLEAEFRDDIVKLEELFDVDLGRWK
jgi:hypothetical protein